MMLIIEQGSFVSSCLRPDAFDQVKGKKDKPKMKCIQIGRRRENEKKKKLHKYIKGDKGGKGGFR